MQRLGQQHDLLGVDADFAGLGLEHEALHADHVAQIVVFEVLVRVLAHVVPADVDLNLAVAVQQMGEGGLAHDAAGHHAPGDGHGLVLQRVVIAQNLAGEMGAVVADDLIGVLALFHELAQLFQTDAALLGHVRLLGGADFFCHGDCSSP